MRRVILGVAVLVGVGMAAFLALGLGPEQAVPAGEPSRLAETQDPSGHLERNLAVSNPRSGKRETGGFLSGLVSASDAGRVSNAQVCAQLRERDASDEMHKPTCARTAASGRYRIGPLLPGRYSLAASLEGYQSARYPTAGDPDLGVQAEQTTEIDLVLTPGGVAVRGRVVDAFGGPIAGAVVEGKRGRRGGVDAFTISTPDGRFTLWMPEGAMNVRARAEGYGADRRTVVAPSDGVELRLFPGATVHGEVVWSESGAPAGRARVSASGNEGRRGSGALRTVVADERGRFTLDGLSPGRIRVSAELKGGYGESAETLSLAVLESAGPVRIELRPSVTLSIEV
ncbi:MAG: carboxypeptidase-like regulatory domain-containing protein, partial [Myxococcota bacterium]